VCDEEDSFVRDEYPKHNAKDIQPSGAMCVTPFFYASDYHSCTFLFYKVYKIFIANSMLGQIDTVAVNPAESKKKLLR
jgi:hypothetical protein